MGNLKAPRLNAIEIEGRPAVFYSREDLTEGMVGEPIDGISGYTPQTAIEMMRNMVLYSGFGVRPGAAGATTKPTVKTSPKAPPAK